MRRRGWFWLAGGFSIPLLAATVSSCSQTVVLEYGTDGGSPSNDGGSSSDAHCTVASGQALQFKTVSPEVIVALDRSAAMTAQLPATLTALFSQVQNYQNVIRFGFVDFPDTLDSCPNTCCIGPLTTPPQMPTGSQTFLDAAYFCNSQGTGCATSASRPTEIALRGCYGYYQNEQQANGRYVLLITNGDPNGNGEPNGRCGTPKGDCADAEYEVGMLHGSGVGVQTFIVDLGPQSNPNDCLHELATAQGENMNGAPYYYFAGAGGLNDVLSTITGTIAKAACHLALSMPPPDRSQVSITYYDGTPILPDDINGWSFEQGNSVGIMLNGAACQAFIRNKAYPQGLVVTSGCASPHGGQGGL